MQGEILLLCLDGVDLVRRGPEACSRYDSLPAFGGLRTGSALPVRSNPNADAVWGSKLPARSEGERSARLCRRTLRWEPSFPLLLLVAYALARFPELYRRSEKAMVRGTLTLSRCGRPSAAAVLVVYQELAWHAARGHLCLARHTVNRTERHDNRRGHYQQQKPAEYAAQSRPDAGNLRDYTAGAAKPGDDHER